ncbi:MAG: hypothetical protein H0U53_10920 [Actinobacteria bacterium]|nr:hypothetical protein [Actinomycetota bacterium]
MAIPGLKPSFELRAKVRIGEKGKTASGKEYPKSTDHFLCDDADFKRVTGMKPKSLTITLPHQASADNFTTGLEQWAGAMLVCYTKGEQHGEHVAAFRKKSLKRGGQVVDLLQGFTVIGDEMGNERMPVICRDRTCPMMVKGDCKPMGRLQFFIKGIDPTLGVYQFDTKSWNTIEKIEGFLQLLGDPRGQELTLSVEMWSKGTSKFPVVTLEGGNVIVETDADILKADAMVTLHKHLASVESEGGDARVRKAFAQALDVTNPGWRDRPEFVERIKFIGVVAAAKGLLARNEL